MPNIRQPRSGSMQFWPRKRSKRAYARVRNFPETNSKGLLGFVGYKVGMTHVQAIETAKYSHKKGEEISIPVTIIECPPLKISSLKLYKKSMGQLKVAKEMLVVPKDSSKKTKSIDFEKINPDEYEDIKVTVLTQPGATGIGKKKPEAIEMAISGNNAEKLQFVKENLDKDILPETVFEEGAFVDIKAVTKGKGFQGPVKRFGVSIRQAKSEKAIRNPGSLGPWSAQGHIMWRVAHAGKMGYHQRTEYNKQILKLAKKEELDLSGGFINYGVVRNTSVLIKGSVPGASKRTIIFTKPMRYTKRVRELPTLQKINLQSNQGN